MSEYSVGEFAEYGELRRRVADGFERFRASRSTLATAWSASSDATAAAVDPDLGRIAVAAAQIDEALAAHAESLGRAAASIASAERHGVDVQSALDRAATDYREAEAVSESALRLLREAEAASHAAADSATRARALLARS